MTARRTSASPMSSTRSSGLVAMLALILCAVPGAVRSQDGDAAPLTKYSGSTWLGSAWDAQAGDIHFFVEHRRDEQRGYVRGCAVLPGKQVVRSPLVPVTHERFGGDYPHGLCGAVLDDRSRAYILVRTCDSDGPFGAGNCTVAAWVLDLHEQRYLGEVSWPEEDRRVFSVAPIPGTSCLLEQSLLLRWDPAKDGPPALRLRVLNSQYQALWQADYEIAKVPNERPPHSSAADFVRGGKSGIVHIGSERIEVRCTRLDHPVVIEQHGDVGEWSQTEQFPKG